MFSHNQNYFICIIHEKEQAQNTRKSETDVIVPLLPQIRAEGQFRWNQISRLRQAYLKACEQAKIPNGELPFF